MAFLAGGHARRMVITYHSDIVRQKGLLRLYAPFLRRVLLRADRIMPTNQRYVETSPYLRPVAAKCTVVPLGIDLGRFAAANQAQVEAIHRQYGQPLLVFVGRLRYYKGLEYLIRAMKQTPARLLVIGTGPMEKPWKALTAELGLTDKVIFLGDVDDADLPSYHYASTVFVLPSSQRSEAYGVSMLEGMACGLPAVSTELGTGTSYVNQDGETGLVVPPCDPGALAQAIGRLLSDDALRTRFGQAARRRAWGLFSLEAMVDRILAVYDEVLAESSEGVK
jgi:glycosyltransferase involved in cell wall biosynthesis